MSKIKMLRRDWLASVTALGGGLWLGSGRLGEGAQPSDHAPGGFRFVHLSDIHVQPESQGAEGFAACLHQINELDPKPDFILTGGDLIMDALAQDRQRTDLLFSLLNRLLAEENDLPVYHCIGNHDVFGWAQKHGVTPETPGYGKQRYCEVMDLDRPYYTFDHKGWRFFVMDDIQYSESSVYVGEIDGEQMEWLLEELQRKPADMPAVAVSHIPLLSVTFLPNGLTDGSYRVGAGTMCNNSQTLAQTFADHNVRLVLSGHIHMVDRVEYRGVTYVCDGAVSGAWWKGQHRGFEEGFGIIDLGADGSLRHTYHDYGWQVG